MADKAHLDRQRNFNGGEIAPLSYGRTDSAAYQHGLRTALNMIPTLEGPILNRSGTRFVCAVKDSTYEPRLKDFTFADGQNFILEIGDFYIRFVRDGAQVETAPGSGVAYEIVSPWAIADVERLTFAQSGDVIQVRHPSYAPYEIERISNTNWTVAAVSYSGQPYWGALPYLSSGVLVAPGGGGAGGQDAPGSVVACSDRWDAATTYAQGQFVLYITAFPLAVLMQSQASNNLNNVPLPFPNAFWLSWNYATNIRYKKGAYAWFASTETDGELYISQTDNNFGHAPTPGTTTQYWAPAADPTRPPKPWQFVLTRRWRDELGDIHESLASTPTTATPISIYTDRPAKIEWRGSWAIALDPGPATYTELEYGVYGGINGIYGLIGTAPADATSFVYDATIPPDFGIQPPRGTNPFDIATGAGTKTQSWPGVVTHHEQRDIEARSDAKPQDFWGSAIGKPKVFDINTPVQDSDAFNFKPQSDRLEEIRWALSLDQLVLGTSNGVFNADGANGPITATSILLKRSNQKGASYLHPVVAEEAALYQTKTGRIRDLQYDWRVRKYTGRDVSVIARHLFEGRTIVDWCYAETPYNLVWAVRDDGVLISLTYAPGQAEAWARHSTVGRFERVASTPETDDDGVTEDAVYVVAQRLCAGLPVRYIERFSTRIVPQLETVNDDLTSTFTQDVRTCNFLDSALEYDGRQAEQTLATGLGGYFTINSVDFPGSFDPLVYAPGAQITVAASVGLPFVAGDVGFGAVVLDPDNVNGDGPISANIVGFTNGGLVTCELVDQMTAEQVLLWTGRTAPLFAGSQDWAVARSVITGLDHLEGQSVNALVDGAVAGPFDVLGGSITLGTPGVIVQVGLGYDSDLELLDLAADSVKVNVMSVRKAFFEVVSSRGLLVGETFDLPPDSTGETEPRLVPPQLQQVKDGNTVPPLFTGTAGVPINSSWNTGARMCLRQSDPLPLTVTGAIRDVVIGGR